MFMNHIEDRKASWDELISVLALALNSRPNHTTELPPRDPVTPRRLSNISQERMPDCVTPDPRQ